MDKKICIYIVFFITIFCNGYGQKPFIQLQTSGGYSLPLSDAALSTHFADPGWNAHLSFTMFYGKFGITAGGGFQQINAYAPFQRYIADKYKDIPSVNSQYWTNAYGMIGPAFKLTFGKAELDFFAQIGMGNLSVPDLVYQRRLIGQNVEIARYSGENSELTPFWKGGLAFHYRVYKGLGIYIEPSFMSNMFLRKTKTNFRFVDAFDNNLNGAIDEVEFTEAQIVRDFRDMVFSSANINLGISVQLGKTPKKTEPVPMISLEEENKETEITENAPEPEPIVEEKIADPMAEIDFGSDSLRTQPSVIKEEGPVVVQTTNPTMVEKSETNYDDSEAGFLYKAGELYFQTNDYENAVACFNKIKNDPKQLMAKYMFALAMCEMANCEEAEKEYQAFAAAYDKDDKGVLYTVYKSHQKKCVTEVEEQKAEVLRQEAEKERQNKLKSADSDIAESSVNTSGTNKKTEKEKAISSPSPDGKTYKIQFVALRMSNKTFPRMEGIGDITHEFYPKKAMYRYNLGPYNTEDEAVSDMLKVRAMGFQDAFLAVYKNGKRINTLYHAK